MAEIEEELQRLRATAHAMARQLLRESVKMETENKKQADRLVRMSCVARGYVIGLDTAIAEIGRLIR